jgi:hypothetical protein
MQPTVNYFQKTSKIKLVLLLFLFFVIIIAAFISWNYFVIQKAVTLEPSPGTTISIGNQKGSSLSLNQPIISATATKKVRLQPGPYVVEFSGSKDYMSVIKSIEINNSMIIKTPILYYTDSKLNQLLNSERPTIQAALFSSFNSAGYSVVSDQLFENGEWYGAQLIPQGWYNPNVPSDYTPRPININNTKDMLRVIMKKENGQWKPVAGPSVVFFIGDYPNIPQTVIRGTNKLGPY